MTAEPFEPKLKSCWTVYIIRCVDGSLYTGITTDVQRRLGEHCITAVGTVVAKCGRSLSIKGKHIEDDKHGRGGKRGRGAKALRGKGPLKLVFTTVAANRSAALKTEYRIKQLSKLQKEKLVVGEISLAELLCETESE
ncbi:MAG: GIY-YIG nuclease family protein [Gammaproteobacteria bacterium]|nr:GIY-YIG nuclease family protein [Gammaproteobacteria bacterium]MCY4358567.1 GIY-YIG nuclease family protein [Gammaproteobacteria bacterium]